MFQERYNVLKKIFQKAENYVQQPIDICISDYLLHTYWLNYFSCAEGVPKAIENMWKFVLFIVYYLILRFARSSAYHHAHKIDTYGYLCYGYFGCQCSIVEKLPQIELKMGGYALEL